MNANELADCLDIESSQAEYGYVVDDWKLFRDAANMLRQQQAEIEALKKLISEMKYEKSSGVYEMNNKPVAWLIDASMTDCDDNFIWNTGNYPDWQVKDWIPLYTHPVKELTEEKSYEVVFDGEKYTTKLVEPKVKELTDEEINQVALEVEWHCDGQINHEQFAKAILRKAQEK